MRLVGEPAVRRLMGAHVVVVGLGGVGGHVAEALARSAVGRLTLIDFDHDEVMAWLAGQVQLIQAFEEAALTAEDVNMAVVI